MMRCAARWCALVGLLLHTVGALPAGLLYAPGRRAIGAFPGGPSSAGFISKDASPSSESSSSPYMTLKPFHPVAKPSKRALVPGASPWAPAPPPTVDPTVYASKKADFLSKLFAGLGPAAPGGPAAAGPMGPMVSPGFWLPPTPVAATEAPADDDDDMSKMNLLAQLVSAVVDQPEPTLPPFVPPTPKPTIVPPGFWVPDSPIMPPGAYKAKVATFLGKLFSSLNITMGPPAGGAKVARHSGGNRPYDNWLRALPPQVADNVSSVVSALTAAPVAAAPAAPVAAAPQAPAPTPVDPKDIVVNSILSEVSQLKGAFMDTLADMMVKQKELVAQVVPTKKPKFLPPWVPTPPPTPDPLEPFQKRIDTLGQVFDMLTALGREVTGPSPPAGGAAPSRRMVRSAPGRSVQMAVHQGYQSMPPGTQEEISLGAGRDPESAHEGGGLNLRIKMPESHE